MTENNETMADLMPTTPDLRAERLAELKNAFPDLFTNEGRLNDDELCRLVDPDGAHETERYEFRWHGKSRSKREAFTPSTATLVYDPDRSVNPAKANGNMIIEAENLEALKLLLCGYREQVKCIYIDPPYNTGNDFIYSDNYAEDRQRYWESTEASENGVKLQTNPETSGRFHSDWLCMMQARLHACRHLLTRDGFIVVSIDDAEVHNLRRLLDDTFGEENHIATLVWDRNRKNDAKFFSVGHEYMVIYARDKLLLREMGVILRAEKEGVDEVREHFERLRKEHADDWSKVREGLQAIYSEWKDDDPRKPLARFTKVDEKGPYRDDGNINWPGGGGPRYEVLHPTTKKPCKLPVSGWRYPTPERFWEEYEHGHIVFGPDESTIPSVRTNLFDKSTQVMRSVFFSYAQTASNEFAKIFDGVRVFDNPKHFTDIRQITEYLSEPGDIVVDFFAGSGTTGHAVLLSNAESDETARTFILVQLPEAIAEDESAYKAGYRKISDICIERCKRVIQGYGDNPKPIDAGFKVYTLAKSNFPRVDFRPDPNKSEAENVEALKQYIREKEAAFTMQLHSEQLFDEVLLKNGFMLDYALTGLPAFKKNKVYRAKDAHKQALVCLDVQSIADETIAELKANHGEEIFICLERALDTTTKWNLKHILGPKLVAF